MVHKEKASLWRIKHLLTRLSGDHTWIPCENVETDNDIALFRDERDRHQGHQLGKLDKNLVLADTLNTGGVDQAIEIPIMGSGHRGETSIDTEKELIEDASISDDIAMLAPPDHTAILADDAKEGRTTNDLDGGNVMGGDFLKANLENPPVNHLQASVQEIMTADPSAEQLAVLSLPDDVAQDQIQVSEAIESADIEGVINQEELPAPHRMRTRAQAQAASDNTAASRTRSMTPNSPNESFVHPYFLAPQASHPDRDVGLPGHEAEETRRLLQLYVQKQEEVCRGAQRVYEGLLKADRYRKMVMKWAKAEAHVGVNRDMSDGEDWYDKEEWGLDEDLKKGQDEEEEDAATTAKKTRTRRQ